MANTTKEVRWLALLEVGAIVAAPVVVVAALLAGGRPDTAALALFGALLVWAENAAVVLPTTARLSPSFMVVMAALAAFDQHGPVAGSAVVGLCGGLVLDLIRRRRYRIVAFNCAQYALAGAAAAVAQLLSLDMGLSGGPTLVVAGLAFAAVNVALVLPATVLSAGSSPRAVWADMAPTLPNYLAFGLLGTLIGQLYNRFGPLSVLAMLSPLLVARSVFSAYRRLRQAYHRLEILYAFAGSMGTATDVASTATATLRQVRSTMMATHAELALIDPATGAPGSRFIAARSDEHRPLLLPSAPLSAFETDALKDGQPHRVSTESDDPRWRADLTLRSWSQAMVAPIFVGSQPAAVLLVGDVSGDRGPYDAEELQLLGALAKQVGVALEKGRLIEHLEYQSLHDVLTGLANRAFFALRLAAVLQSDTGRRHATMVINLDRFSEINESLGYRSGDELLRQIGLRLVAAARPGDVVARLGGDEFALLLEDVASDAVAVDRAEAVLQALMAPITVGDIELEVAASIGVAVSPDHGRSADTLLRRADMAMHVAKRLRGRVDLYELGHDERSTNRLALAADLRHAVVRGELELHYQPKIDVPSGGVIGTEALLRWRHPRAGSVPPDEFIPLAEHTGTIRQLTSWVLASALHQCGQWRKAGLELTVAVNLSVRALLDDTLPTEVGGLLASNELPPEALTLEITESSIMSDPERMIAVLVALADLGVKLSIDDFGTGYSSLSYLKRLPVHELKVDRSFVKEMATDVGDATIVASTIELGRRLGLTVVAEGVEDEATMRALDELGCPVAQGYLLARPMPVEAIDAWLLTAGAE